MFLDNTLYLIEFYIKYCDRDIGCGCKCSLNIKNLHNTVLKFSECIIRVDY